MSRRIRWPGRSRAAWTAVLLTTLLGCNAGKVPQTEGDSDAGGRDAGAEERPGFTAQYFDLYHDLAHEDVEEQIDHTWDASAPARGVAADRFAARYSGTLTVPEDGAYSFATLADDGVRLWVGDKLVIDDWRAHFPERHAGTAQLEAGEVAIRLEYFEVDKTAELHLYWVREGEDETLLGAPDVTSSAASDEAPHPPYKNPVTSFPCAQPGVMATGDPPVYFAICSGGGLVVRRSYDLVFWANTGAKVLPDGKPAWAANGDNNRAAEMHEVAGRFVVYYTSVDADNVPAIGAAVADAPTGPFSDIGHPLVEHPLGVSDPTYVRDADGKHYLLFKVDGNAHGQLAPIFARELEGDGLSFSAGSTAVELIRNTPSSWEGSVVEAPQIIHFEGVYYLFYSGNLADYRYRTGVARASSVLGPYQKLGTPILGNDGSWVGPGHGSIVPIGDSLYFAYHAWYEDGAGRNDSARDRVMLVDQIEFADGWPVIHDGTPSDGWLPRPGTGGE